jgi:hypothetical protein
MESGHERVGRNEAGVVIVLAAQRRGLRDRPIRARAPGPHVDETLVVLDSHRDGAGRGSSGTPDGSTVASQVGAGAERRESEGKIERPAHLEPGLGVSLNHTLRLVTDGHREGERASEPAAGFDREVAFVHARDLSRQPEAESCALDVLRAVDPAEAREQV